MTSRRLTWGRLACAACLALCAAFAYQSLAAARLTTGEASVGGRRAPVLRGKVPLAFGAFELSVAFTPDGSIQDFYFGSANAKRCGEV